MLCPRLCCVLCCCLRYVMCVWPPCTKAPVVCALLSDPPVSSQQQRSGVAVAPGKEAKEHVKNSRRQAGRQVCSCPTCDPSLPQRPVLSCALVAKTGSVAIRDSKAKNTKGRHAQLGKQYYSAGHRSRHGCSQLLHGPLILALAKHIACCAHAAHLAGKPALALLPRIAAHVHRVAGALARRRPLGALGVPILAGPEVGLGQLRGGARGKGLDVDP